MTSERSSGPSDRGNAPPTRRFQRSRMSAAEQRRLQAEVREVDFPMALRGYDRAAVDRYVTETNRLIAELELSSSPESAVRHALDEVSEETSGLLQRAYETAEEIAARSRAKADDRLQQAEREAQALYDAASRDAEETRSAAQRDTQELRATAKREAEQLRAETEARVQELERHADTIWRERRRLLDEMRTVAQEQLEIAEAALARFPQPGVTANQDTTGTQVTQDLGRAEEPTAEAPADPE